MKHYCFLKILRTKQKSFELSEKFFYKPVANVFRLSYVKINFFKNLYTGDWI